MNQFKKPSLPQKDEQKEQHSLFDEPQFSFGEEDVVIPPKKKKNLLIPILGILAVVILGASLYMFMSKDKQPSILGTNENVDLVGDGVTPTNIQGGEEEFTGSPIPVKWSTDVTPTRMEIQLDNNGDPTIILVGDKSGLGTVIRSYNKKGNLSGHWVIVPDDGAENSQPQQNQGQQQQQQQQQNQGQQQQQPPQQEQQGENSGDLTDLEDVEDAE